MTSTTSERMRVRIAGFFSSIALRLVATTWRIETAGLGKLDKRLAAREKQIAVFWHGKYYSLLPILRDRDVCVFTSISHRGAIIADILRRFGYQSVQLPDHGGDSSLDIMRTYLKEHHAGAIAVDGPLGPYHAVHRGAIQIASELGHSIIPLSISAGRKTVLTERWDQFEMPLMFSKIQIVVGDPIRIPPLLDITSLDYWTREVNCALNQVDQQANTLLVSR